MYDSVKWIQIRIQLDQFHFGRSGSVSRKWIEIREGSKKLWEIHMKVMNNISNIHLTASLRDALGLWKHQKILMMESPPSNYSSILCKKKKVFF